MVKDQSSVWLCVEFIVELDHKRIMESALYGWIMVGGNKRIQAYNR